jgi:hypothetical protein
LPPVAWEGINGPPCIHHQYMVRNLMKFPSNLLVPIPGVGARPDPAFTMEERIVIRALVAGKTGKEMRQSPADCQFIPPPDARSAGKDWNGHELVSDHLGAAEYEKLRPTSKYTGQIRKTCVNSQSRLTSTRRRDGSPLIVRDSIERKFCSNT